MTVAWVGRHLRALAWVVCGAAPLGSFLSTATSHEWALKLSPTAREAKLRDSRPTDIATPSCSRPPVPMVLFCFVLFSLRLLVRGLGTERHSYVLGEVTTRLKRNKTSFIPRVTL